jgi:hypothetical protein
VLDGAYAEGLALIRQAITESRAGPAAPGIEAILSRILLAASTATGDAATVVAAADTVIAAGLAYVLALSVRNARFLTGSRLVLALSVRNAHARPRRT